VEFLVLGPLEVLDGQASIPLGSAKQRLLLAALLVHANAVVSVDRLADVLWGDEPPADAVATLHTYVSRLRVTLEPGRAAGDPALTLLTRAPGYLLGAGQDEVDAFRFEELVTEGQRHAAGGDPASAARVLDRGLALWRGNAFAEFADHDFARTESIRLEELRRVATDERVEANLSLGRHAEMVGELEGIVAADRLRERPRGQLMVALYRSGREAEALRAYQDYRQYLAEDIGVDPSTALQRLEHDIVHRSPHLAWTPDPAPAPRIEPPRGPVAVGTVSRAETPPTTGGERRDQSAHAIVGRSSELDQLRHWLAESLGGSPRVVLLTGAEGVGKSRLITELIAEARPAGVRPLGGRCLEDSELPLLPVATVLDALGVGSGGYEAPDRAASSDEHGSRRSVVVDAGRALMAAAAERPALLVLEDAQWADAATVEFVAHVAATVAHEAVFRQLPVMLLVTARPEGASPHARRLLTRLARESTGRSLHVEGLDELGAFAFLASETGVRPSVGLLRVVREATAGNPAEISALVARLERVGAVSERDGELVTTVRTASALPVEVDASVNERLQAMSTSARHLLITLALLRDGTLESVRIAVGLGPDDFERALDEATDTGLVTDDGYRVDFADSSTRRTLTRSTSGRRRHRMHAEIALRLSASGSIAATEIAEQLERAGPEADPTQLASYARVAADDALALGAWADAARHYETALQSAVLDDAQRAALEQSAAIAAYRSNDPRAAADHAERAAELGRQIGDLAVWGEAALVRARAVFVSGVGGDRRADVGMLEEFLEAAGDDEPALRARVHATLSEFASTRWRYDMARAHAEIAEEIASQVHDRSVAARVAFVAGLERFGSLELDAAEAHFGSCEEQARLAHDTLIESWGLGREPLVLFSRGRLDAAAAAASRAARHDREHGWWGEYSLVGAVQVGLAVAQGNLGAAERLAVDAVSAHRRAEQVGVGSLLWSAIAGARVLVGDAVGAHQALDEWEREEPRAALHWRALVDALSDTPRSTERGVDGLAALVHAETRVDLTTVGLAASVAELADVLGRPEIAARAFDLLAQGYERGVRFTVGWCLFVPRLAGVACMLALRHDDAEEWLGRALVDARAAGATGEVARVNYDLARNRAAAGRVDETSDLLDAAIGEFERLGYRPLLADARLLAGRPERAEADAPVTRVILVTDVVDSTPLAQRLGDRRFVELLREHNRIVRGRLRQFDGIEFKHTGDGIAAWFLTAGATIRCALGIQEDLERYNASHADELHVRIGVSAGDVISHDGDLFGLAVIEAFRVCDQAADGRILVSDDVPRLVRDATIGFDPVSDVVLKGFSDSRTLHEVAPVRG